MNNFYGCVLNGHRWQVANYKIDVCKKCNALRIKIFDIKGKVLRKRIIKPCKSGLKKI